MPTAPQTMCAGAGCAVLVPSGSGGRCDAHRRAVDVRRGNKAQRGYGSDWERFTAHLMATTFWSVYGGRCACGCGHRFQDRSEVQWDHIVALKRGGARLDPKNCQPLTRPCHQLKTARGE